MTESKAENGGRIFVLNLSTFTHEEFGPGKEEFLPPRNLETSKMLSTTPQRTNGIGENWKLEFLNW